MKLEKKTKYWLEVQPIMQTSFSNPPLGDTTAQVAVILSDVSHMHPAQQIFALAEPPLPDWTKIAGNVGTAADPPCNNLPPGSRQGIAFLLFGEKQELPEPDPHITLCTEKTLTKPICGTPPWRAVKGCCQPCY